MLPWVWGLLLLTPPVYGFQLRQIRRSRFKVAVARKITLESSEQLRPRLVVGINKYSHDSAVCVADARSGEILFACEKERLTRNKHDGGAVGDVVAHALDSLGASIEDVELVVQNNHHHRVAPFEARLPFAVDMGHYPSSYLEPENLFASAPRRLELSHHLAHAWCAVGSSPWSPLKRKARAAAAAAAGDASGGGGGPRGRTLVVVMDGMGETLAEMRRHLQDQKLVSSGGVGSGVGDGVGVDGGGDGALLRSLTRDGGYVHDLALEPNLRTVPASPSLSRGGWREAESAYVVEDSEDGRGFQGLLAFEEEGGGSSDSDGCETLTRADGSGLRCSGVARVRPVWKRWTEERSPSSLENHGFHDMESLGALYSRVSSSVFGDWNACGKVMGLAPWAPVWRRAQTRQEELNLKEEEDTQRHTTTAGAAREAPPPPLSPPLSAERRSLFPHLFLDSPAPTRPSEEKVCVGAQVEVEVGALLREGRQVDWAAVRALEASAPLNGWKRAAKADATANTLERGGGGGGEHTKLTATNDGSDSDPSATDEAIFGGGGGSASLAYAEMALAAQVSLEDEALWLLRGLKTLTNATRLCLAGGVAQNSVLNGRIVRELGFDGVDWVDGVGSGNGGFDDGAGGGTEEGIGGGESNVHIPCCVGDEGVAVGCALFGCHLLATEEDTRQKEQQPQQQKQQQVTVAAATAATASATASVSGGEGSAPAATPANSFATVPNIMSPYTGKLYSRHEIDDAVAEFSNWVEVLEEEEGSAEGGSPQEHTAAAAEAAALAAVVDGDQGVSQESGGGGEQQQEQQQLTHAELVEIALSELCLELEGSGELGGAASAVDCLTESPQTKMAEVVVSSALALARGELVAWFQGRSEFGPRALGARSLLADPRNATLASLINSDVKRREGFRPFAPAVLEEHAPNWFHGLLSPHASPYMGLTVPAKEEKRSLIPGVLHGADSSARLQTVSRHLAPPSYRALLAVFFALTGVPLVLNTSFNTVPGEPIVESPKDALRSFLGGKGPRQRIGRLVLHDVVLVPKPCPLDSLLATVLATAQASAVSSSTTTSSSPPPSPLPSSTLVVNELPEVCFPVRRCGHSMRSEVLSLSDGSTARVRVLVPGVSRDEESWVELTDALDLALLEASTGQASLQELLDEFADDGPDDDDEDKGDSDDADDADDEYTTVTTAELLVRLKRLWELTLVEL